jgi:hypothetical protein
MTDEPNASEGTKLPPSFPNFGLGTALGAGFGVTLWASTGNWIWALAVGAVSGLALAFALPERKVGGSGSG